MKKLFYLLLIFILNASCSNKTENSISANEGDKETITKSEECFPYFDFDEVEYYRIKIDELDALNLIELGNKNDSLKYSIIIEDKLSNISDSILIDRLIEFGFSKKVISSYDFINLNKVFCSNKYSFSTFAVCTPFYRDILIFKKSESISGIVKLCFDCSQSTLTKKEKKLPSLRYNDEKWEELSKLLDKYK